MHILVRNENSQTGLFYLKKNKSLRINQGAGKTFSCLAINTKQFWKTANLPYRL